jgi:hypothetical protein
MTKRITIQKNGEYYRIIAAHYNNIEPVYIEEIVEGKVLKEIKGILFQLLPDWKNIKIEGE